MHFYTLFTYTYFKKIQTILLEQRYQTTSKIDSWVFLKYLLIEKLTNILRVMVYNIFTKNLYEKRKN